MTQKYYVILNSDGDTFVTEMTKEQLLAELAEDGSGYDGKDVMATLDWRDTNYWKGFLIIKGEIVTPEPKQVISSYDIK